MYEDKLIEANRKIISLERHNKELSDLLAKSLKLSELRKQQFGTMSKCLETCIDERIISDRGKLIIINRLLTLTKKWDSSHKKE